MKNWGFRLLIALALFAGLCSTHASTITWKSGSSGNWSVANNWNPKHVPGTNDIAVITANGNYSVTLDIPADVAGLVLGANDGNTQTFSINGQTFTLAGQATVNSGGLINLSSGTFNGDTNSGGAIFNGTLTCAGGALAGTLTLASNSVVNLSGPSSPFNGLVLFTNYGTVNWNNVDLHGVAGLKIFNFNLWAAQANNTFYGSGTSFISSGTFRKSAGGGITTLDNNLVFFNSGLVDVQNAGLAIDNGDGSNNGSFNTASNTTLYFGNYTAYGASIFNGFGAISGSLAGAVNEGGGSNVISSGSMTFSNVVLSGRMIVASNAVMNLAAGVIFTNINYPFGLTNFTLNNFGTVNWGNADLYGFGSPQIYNYGFWNAQANNSFYGQSGSPTVFNNYGTFLKSGGTGGQTFLDNYTTFNNSGTVDGQTGMLTIGVGNLAGSNAEIRGTVNLNVGTLSGTTTLANNVVLNLGLTSQQPVTFQSTILTNYGTVVWNGEDLRGQSGAQIYNYGLWDARTNNTFYGAYSGGGTTTFNNYGTFLKSGGDSSTAPNSTFFDNYTMFNNYGTVDVQTGILAMSAGTGSGTFNNAANAVTFSLINYTLTGNPIFSGPGIVAGNLFGSNAVIHGVITFNAFLNVYWEGTMTLASNTVVNFMSSAPGWSVNFQSLLLTNYGTVNWINTDLHGFGSPQIYNYGLWDDQTNNTFYGAYSGGGTTSFNNYGTFRKSGGTTFDSGFDTELDYNTTFNNYGTLDNQTGILVLYNGTGSGTFNNATNTATEWFGTCVLTGNPTFTGSGVVEGTLNGNNAVVHGTLTSADATLSGTITVASNAVLNLGRTDTQPLSLPGIILTNYGTIVWNQVDLNCQSNAQFNNYGLWDAKANNTIYGAYSGGGVTTFNNFGTFRKSGGSQTSPNNTATILDWNTTFNNPGTIDVQTGLIEFNRSSTLTGGTLNFGINSSSDFGSIWLGNDSPLAGTLSVNLNNNYSPASGSSFNLLHYFSGAGAFTAMSLPHLSGLIWQTNYGAATFTLSVTNVPSPQLSSAAAQNGGMISFSWGTFDGQTYQVQCTTNLSPANWFNLGNPIPGTNGTTTVSDAFGSSPQKFYRVVLPP